MKNDGTGILGCFGNLGDMETVFCWIGQRIVTLPPLTDLGLFSAICCGLVNGGTRLAANLEP